MNTVLEAKRTELTTRDRIIGRYKGKRPGPTVMAIGGVHGNEPSGVYALERVIERLHQEQPDFAGEFIAIAGNLRALESGRRFIDHDLNRMWLLQEDQESLAEMPLNGKVVHERREMDQLMRIIDAAVESRNGPFVCLDLHTTSAESPPFLLIGDTLRNRRFVEDMQLPVILGLEERLNGPLLSYLNTQGHVTIGFEAGQHEDEVSVDNHVCLVWLILERAGCINKEDFPDFDRNLDWLADQTKDDLKSFFEVRHRHAVREHEKFKMRPGYRNFQRIQAEEHLAQNKEGRILAREGGRIFMPLYQSEGTDGFFLIRQVPDFWMKLSVVLRKLGMHKFLRLMPGFTQHPKHDGSLIVNVRVVRWFGPQVLHLLGYRRRSRIGEKLHFIKRRWDLRGPSPLDEFPK